MLKALANGATTEPAITSTTKFTAALVAKTVSDLVSRNLITRVSTFLGTEVLSLRDQSVTTTTINLSALGKR